MTHNTTGTAHENAQNSNGTPQTITPRSVLEISGLFDIAHQEREVIDRLARDIEDLQRARAAMDSLAQLTPQEVRVALEHRRLAAAAAAGVEPAAGSTRRPT